MNATQNIAPGTGIGTAEPSDYLELMKPRVMSLVIFTAWVGYVCAPVNPRLSNMVAIIICIAVGAGASGAFNMAYDADIDAKMTRTRNRPVPRGAIKARTAQTFGIFMSFFAVLTLWLGSNIVAASLLAFTIFFYAVIYTRWLKRSTPQNIVIGGAAGAFPPMIGWAATTGSFSLEPLLMFLIIFLWTPAHFWALALYKTIDYDKAGIPMMPNVEGAASTRAQILAYAALVAMTCAAPVIIGQAGWIYGIVALILNVGFVGLAFKVWRSQAGEKPDLSDEASLYAVKTGDKAARNLFAFSILYLFGIFGALAADHVLSGVL